MAKPQSTQKIVNQLEEAVKTSEELLLVMKKTNIVIEDTAKVLKKGFEGLDKSTSKGLSEFNKLLKEANDLTNEQVKLTKAITKEEKEKADNELRLKKLKEQDIKNLKQEQDLIDKKLKTAITARKEQERQIKNDEKERKAKEKLNSAYAQQSKKLNDLRKRYKDLVVQEGKTTKESRKLLKEIKKLDKELKEIDESAGQFQRSVGNYPKVLGKAEKAIGKITIGVGGAIAAFKGATSALNASEEGSEDLRKVTSALSTTWDQAKNTAGTFALDVFNVSKKLIDNAKDVNGLSKAIDNISNGFDKTSEKVKNFSSDLEQNIEAGQQATQQQIDLEKALRPLNERVAVLNGLFDEQNAIAGDSTKSFDQIEEAAVKAARTSLERARISTSIAQEELDIINNLIDSKTDDFNKTQLLNQQSEATIKLTEAQNAVSVEQIELQKLIAENTRDRFERELDFAIDAFDTIKTINERIVADETTNLEVRRATLDETVKLTDEAFESQKKLFAEFVDARIDFDALAAENDEAEIRRTLRKLGLDNIELGRALEVIRERKIALQDLKEAQRDLTLEEQEAFDLRQKILLQEEALRDQTKDSIKNFEEDITQEEINAAIRRRDATEAGSKARLDAQIELNDLLLEQRRELLEEEERLDQESLDREKERLDREKENLEKRKELAEQALSFLEDNLNKASEKRLEAVDKDLEATEKNINRINEAIANGSEGATESLANEQEKQRKLQQDRERELKRAQRIEASIAVLKVFGANADQPNALGKTISDTTALLAFINSIQGFIDGTENVGESMQGHKVHNGTDGYIARFDGRERIINPSDNAKLGGISNEELTQLGQMYNNGMVGSNVVVAKNDNTELVEEMRGIKKAIVNTPVPSYNYDAKGKYHEQVLKSRNKVEKIRTKANNLFD
jgi:hypothetical protein